jgi:hypothetical protein
VRRNGICTMTRIVYENIPIPRNLLRSVRQSLSTMIGTSVVEFDDDCGWMWNVFVMRSERSSSSNVLTLTAANDITEEEEKEEEGEGEEDDEEE